MADLKTIVNAAIVAGVSAATASPATDAKPTDNKVISDAVKAQVTPLIVNATNSEPWYQSHVTIGVIVSVAVPILSLVGVKADIITADQLTAILTAFGTVVGGVITLYGRWVAKRPIGA